MATAIQRRRGTTTQHSSFTGLAGEITIDTDLNTIIVHDGSTAGGHRLATFTEVSSAATGDITGIVAGSGLTGGATSGSATVNVVGGTGITVNADDIEVTVADIRGMLSASGDIAYNSTTGVISFTNDAGDIESVVAGNGLSGGGTAGDVTLALDLNELTAAAVDVAADSLALIDGTDNSSKKETIADLVAAMAGTNLTASAGVLSALSGDITSVVAGNGMSGGATTGDATLTLDTSSSTFTTGVQSFLAGGTLAGSIIPSADITYDLGSSSRQWKDIYVGPGSLYVNGQQVISDNSGTIAITADTNQNISILTAGTGDIELTSGGDIQLKTDVVLTAAKTISSTGGVKFASNININSNSINNLSDPTVAQDASTKAYVDGATWLTGGDGITNSSATLTVDSTVVRTSGNQSIAGNKTFSGTTTISGALASTGTSVEFADNLLTLNADATGTPSDNVGIIVERGDSTNVQLRWNEADDTWEYTNDGAAYKDLISLDSISVTDAGGDGSATYNNGTGVITYTGPSATETRAHFSATDSGGDGSLTYSAGVYTYTGPSATEVRAHSSGGDGIDYASGVIDVDATVVRTAGTQTIAGAKTFSDNAIFNGNLTVNGTQTVLNTETLTVDDNLIVLNNNEAGTPSADAGLEVERGTSTNVKLQWDESADVWQFTRDGTAWHTINTEAEIEGFFSATDAGGDGSLTYSSGVFTYTGPNAAETRAHLSAGTGMTFSGGEFATTITQYTDAMAEAAISVTDSGGDGSLTYSAGTITYTGPSATETRAHFSAGTGINIASGVISLTDTGYITGVTAGTGLSGGATSGTATLNVSGLTVAELAAGSLQISSESFADNDTTLMTSAAVANKIEAYGYSTTTGDITAVVAGTGLSGGATSGSATLTVDSSYITGLFSGGTGITYSAGAISLTDTGYITGVVAGTLLDGGGTSGTATLNVDLSELPDMTAVVTGTADELVLLDAGVQSRKLISEITLSDFNNDNGWTSNVGDITGVTAGTGLSGGGSSGSVTLNVTGLTTAQLAAGSLQLGSESFVDSDSVLMTAAAVQDKILAYGYSTTTGDITGVTAGTHLTGGGASGSVTLNVSTGAVANGGTSIPTGNDVYDHVTGRISGFTGNVGDITNVAVSGTGLSGGGTSGAVTITSNATSANTGSTIVARDGSGNFSAGVITATATTARYADLAEIYSADAEIEAGTVVMFGGDAEVTACGMESCHAVAGVVSTDPAYLMNSEADGVAVALTGRVPTKVTGPVAPGDLMVSSGLLGHAKADNNAQSGRIIGKAIGSSEGGETVVEVLINLM